MSITVKELSKLSGTSVRTLHFYDEINLLKPAFVGDNGYRYYKEPQLMILQQILFFKELGLELKDIQVLMKQGDSDRLKTLMSHRDLVMQKSRRMKTLIQTIDKTIKHLEGDRKMKNEELFEGFIPEKQTEYETYLKNRFGADNPAFAESQKNVKGWSKADWQKVGEEWNLICQDLAELMQKKQKHDSSSVQSVIKRHFDWIKKFWTPNKESYSGLGKGYLGFEWKKAFAAHDDDHPKLAMFLSKGMDHFAQTKLK